MVKVYKDIVSGDEMCSDGYPNEELYDGAAIKVEARYVIKGSEDYGIASNLDEEAPSVEGAAAAPPAPGEIPKSDPVIDIVDHFSLKPTKHDKKSFQTWLKGKNRKSINYLIAYLNRVKKYLEENKMAERIPKFQKGALDFAKFILSKFDDFQL